MPFSPYRWNLTETFRSHSLPNRSESHDLLHLIQVRSELGCCRHISAARACGNTTHMRPFETRLTIALAAACLAMSAVAGFPSGKVIELTESNFDEQVGSPRFEFLLVVRRVRPRCPVLCLVGFPPDPHTCSLLLRTTPPYRDADSRTIPSPLRTGGEGPHVHRRVRGVVRT